MKKDRKPFTATASRDVQECRARMLDITERKQSEFEREATVEFLRQVNSCTSKRDLIEASTTFFQRKSGCEAVGIRLREGDDYPYYETRGFPAAFVKAENSLCAKTETGEILRDGQGNPVLECMCGNVIKGRFDPSKPFFTTVGSFWTNSTTGLLSSTGEADRQARTRNRCNGEGYESVALIPLYHKDERLGLLQLNGRREGLFAPAVIALWERLAGYLSVAFVKLRADEALRESEENYRRIVETANEGIWAMDGAFLTTYVNHRMADMLGCSPEEMIGRRVDTFMFAEDIEDHSAKMAVRQEGGDGVYERRFRHKGGGEVWAIVSATALKDEDGRFAGSFAMFTDITLRKQAEASSRLYEKMASGSIDSMALVGRDYVYRAVNEAFLKRVGLPREQVVDRHPAEVLGRKLFEDVLKPNLDLCLRGQMITFSEWFTYPVLGRRYMEVSYSPYREPEGGISGVVLNARDITERKITEEQLRSSEAKLRDLNRQLQNAREEERRRIAREIHDELGQNITALKIDLSWLKRKADPEQVNILRKLQSMNDVVDATLQTVRRVSSELRPGVLDVLGLTAAVEWLVRDFGKRSEIQCDLHIEPEEIEVEQNLATDVFRILQEALTNIARHAQATRANVTLRQEEGMIELRVRDNGIGISEAKISNSISLGLLGIRERLLSWGGVLDVRGLPGEGTSFIATIPTQGKAGLI